MPDTRYNEAFTAACAFGIDCVNQATISDKSCRAAICRIAVHTDCGGAEISGCPEVRLIAPRRLAACKTVRYLALESRGPEHEPIAIDPIDQEPLIFGAESCEPVQRLCLRSRSYGHHHIHRRTAPDKVGSQHDHVGSVRTHPVRQRARCDQPPADEFPAWVLRTFRIDRTAMRHAEGARLSLADLVPAHLDLEPAIATGRATSAISRARSVHAAGCC